MISTRAHRPRIDPGQMIAAIPALLRFHPAQSLVVIGFTSTGTRRTVRCALRLDVPDPTELPAARDQLTAAMIANDIDLAVLVIIAEGASGTTLPHRATQQELLHAFAEAHVDVAEALWVAQIKPGIPWRSYVDVERSGTVPDPSSLPVTMATVLVGEPIYPSRADLVALLAPDPAPLLARRATRLTALPPVDPESGVRLIHALLDDLAADPATEAVPEEDTLVRAAHALTHHAVREAGLACLLTERAEAAQRLWTILTRTTPAPVVAHPASLLAAAVFLLGDGALANIALDIALLADPTNVLATTVRTCLDVAMSPELFRQLLAASFHAAHGAPSADPGPVDAGGDRSR